MSISTDLLEYLAKWYKTSTGNKARNVQPSKFYGIGHAAFPFFAASCALRSSLRASLRSGVHADMLRPFLPLLMLSACSAVFSLPVSDWLMLAQ